MASIDYRYSLARQKVSAIPPELRAIPSTYYDQLLQQRAQSEADRLLQNQQIANRMLQAEYETAQPKQFLREAKREYKRALPMAVTGVGFAGLGAYNNYIAERAQQQEMAKMRLEYNIIMRAIEGYSKEEAGAYRIPPELYNQYTGGR